MNRRQFTTAITAFTLAGCAERAENEDVGRLDLTIQSERPDTIAVDVTVVDEAGTTYAEVSDYLESGTTRSFEFAVGTSGRHEATVASDEWRSQIAWDVDTCSLYEALINVSSEEIQTLGECAGSSRSDTESSRWPR